jgi:hypothetical protein
MCSRVSANQQGQTMVTNTRSGKLTVKELFFNSLQLLCLACGLAQVFISNAYDNVIPTMVAVATTSAMLQYLRCSDAMTTNPLSSLALLGLTVSSQLAALIAQTLDATPFTELLRAPLRTFCILGIVHLLAILTHWVYRTFKPLTNASTFISDRFTGPLKIHTIPSPEAIWILAALGFLASAFGGGDFGDVGGKFLAGFIFLLWMPFLIPIYHELNGDTYCNIKKQATLIAIYALLIITLALIKNFRAMMFIGPLQYLFIILVHRCRKPTPINRSFLKGTIILMMVSAFSLTFLSDLMMAMELSRAKRDKVAASEMIALTYDSFTDKEELTRYRAAKDLASVLQRYDENYLHNPMMARFSETKFHDNMLYFADRMNDEDRQEIIKIMSHRIIAIIPQNILDFFEINVKKDQYVFSMGDVYLDLDTGAGKGGYATGSIWADCYTVGGLWSPLLACTFMLVSFIVLDSLSRFDAGHYISPVAFCTVWHIYLYGVGGESLSFKATQIIRDIPQKVILYALALFIVNSILKLVQPHEATRVRLTPHHTSLSARLLQRLRSGKIR